MKSGQIFSLRCREGPGLPTLPPAALFKNERKKLCTKEFVRQAKILPLTQLQKHPSKVRELLLALISSNNLQISIFQFTCFVSCTIKATDVHNVESDSRNGNIRLLSALPSERCQEMRNDELSPFA